MVQISLLPHDLFVITEKMTPFYTKKEFLPILLKDKTQYFSHEFSHPNGNI